MGRVVVTGATGLIGGALVSALRNRGDEVVVLTRDPARATATLGSAVEAVVWSDPLAEPAPAQALKGANAVVHLLGETISQRWSPAAKQRIQASRELGTRNLVSTLTDIAADERPGVLVSQSAVGYYGARGDQELDETAPGGSDFLARVVRQWESEALAAQALMRVAVTRTGLVLGPHGGALAKMLPFFRLGVGGPVAGGRQYLSWVHLDDVIGAVALCIDDARAAGPLNVTAPRPVENAEFARALGRVLHRPTVLPVPGFALSLLYGEMSEIVTTGQRAIPARLTELGYRFAQPELERALADVLTA
jgi:uncharacterized protein (TIGR01777 family)